MASKALRVALLSLTIAGTAATATGDDGDVRKAITELEAMVKDQRDRISKLRERNDALEQEERRLADDDHNMIPSIHQGTAPLPGYRAYSTEESLQIGMDHTWLLFCGALVMAMQAGFALVESGCCRFKNVQNVLLKNLIDVCVGTVGWYIFGWSFAFSGPFEEDGFRSNRFAGDQQFVGHTFNPIRRDGQIEPSGDAKMWFFQWAFCGAAATIVSGGVAERVNFPGYLIFSFLMTSFIYPIVVAWSWGMGFLADMNDVGYFDFAGSGIVHMTGGVGALVGAAIAGPRAGRWLNTDGSQQSGKERITTVPEGFNPHNIVLVVLGTFVLWFGWYGFNCGSTLGLSNIESGFMAAHVAMNTTIAASVGGLTVFTIRYAMLRKFDVGGFCNGILAGLVSITAGCGNLESGSALAAALIGAFVYQGASSLLRAAKIDDVVDAFPVHGACGAWGVLAAAFFDWGQGFNHVHGWSGFQCMKDANGVCLEGLGGDLIAAAFAEIFVIILWVGGLCAIIFGILKALGMLVASNDMQEQGFDMLKHSPSKAYWVETVAELPCTSI
mmetsp:Transcript_97047/g.283617  ORF Transcript_97047/g.283617 Transcript_97047/m.283617 type:complete len:556 (-) Transcript_97047:207-1874(-)